MLFNRILTSAGVLLGVGLAGWAQAAELGDPAAELNISQWIKGEAFSLKDTHDKIRVVEFWATWCGPCRTSIPHLSELQEKFKDDVIFVGISDETEAEVKPFVDKMGEKMEYRVALDDKRQTSKGYMQAYGQNGIPTAFVVDKAGKVAWVGHPMAELELVLEQMVAGDYDMEAIKAAQAAEQMLPDFARLIMSGDENDYPAADTLGAKIIEGAKANPDLLNRIAWALLTDEQIQYRNLELAMRAAKIAYDAKPEDANIIDTYARAFYEKGDLPEALRLQALAVEKADDPGMKAELQKTLEKFQAEANN